MPEKAITSAISSTWAARPKIVVAPMASVCSADCTAVYTGPGAMVLTRTPAGLCSAAQERVNEASDEGADLGGVAQIGGHETGLTALGADLLDDGGPPGRIPAVDHHGETGPRQLYRGRPADPRGGPGDQGHRYGRCRFISPVCSSCRVETIRA
jgi:hypothetical protein